MNKILSILSFILLLSAIEISAKPYEFRGKVVDNNGKPVPNAGVLFTKDCRNCLENLSEFTVANLEGDFYFDVENAKKGQIVKIHVLSGNFEEYGSLIEPPFDEYLEKKSPNYQGIEIILGNKRKVKLGEIKLQLKYQVVKVIFSNDEVQNVFKDKGLWVRIKDDRGNVVESVGLTSNYFVNKYSTIAFLMPEDNWELDFSLTDSPWNSIGKLKINLCENKEKDFFIK